MGFNSALADAGEFGLYQRLLCFVFLLTAIAYLSLSYWIQIFILMVPDHRCRDSADPFSAGSNGTKCGATNFSSNGSRNCPQGWEYDFSTLFPTAATENDWVCENAWRVYVVHTFYWVGSILGQLFFGCLTDRLGRKKTFCWVVLLSVLSNLGTIMAPDHVTFTAARFLTAFGISTISTTSFMIVMEYTGPRNRTIVLCTWAASWTSCAAMLPWMAYALSNWRWLLCIPFLPASVLLFVSWWVPESASWLMTKGQVSKAAELLHKVAEVNGKNLSSQYFYDRLVSSTLESNGTKPEKKESFVQTSLGLVKYPNMRKKTFVLLISWLIIHLCYNGNSLQTSNLPFNIYVSFSVGAFLEIPVNMFCILSLDRFGRKWPDVICLYIGGILGIISGCISQNAEHEIFVMAMLVRITFAAGTNITFQYTAELFPTEVRGRGLSLQRMFGAIGSCLAPTVVFLAEIDRLLPMLVLGCLSLVAGSLIIILPETTGHQLPHTLEEGEKFGAHESICSIFSSKQKNETDECAAKFGRDNLAADVPEGTQGVFILTAKETEAKL
ncbi:solute carrier family 22 member 13-like [Argiope bruennichi]|uniref:solute carrier family 22 member 13-like n=1 Tax=Argiope bruennichi TaxID=94029 RepID=UPI002495A5C8|nr:solute carrier family 22 member 13-like [Argiope bruennichi]